MYTPWGESQTVKEMAPGIVAVTTAGHGGIRLSAERTEQFKKAYPTFRSWAGDGWLEEDCDMILIYFLWADEFPGAIGADGSRGYDLKKYLGYCENYNGDKPYFPIEDIKREMEKTEARIKAIKS